MRRVVGAGNRLMGDDGIGPRLIEALRDLPHGPDVELHDIGNDGFQLAALLEPGLEGLIVVDCARMGDLPGSWRLFEPREVESVKEVAAVSGHGGDLLEVLEMVRRAGIETPPVKFLGIEPDCALPGLELSPVLVRRFPEYLDVLRHESRSGDR